MTNNEFYIRQAAEALNRPRWRAVKEQGTQVCIEGAYFDVRLYVQQDQEGAWQWYIVRVDKQSREQTIQRQGASSVRYFQQCLTALAAAVKREAEVFTKLNTNKPSRAPALDTP